MQSLYVYSLVHSAMSLYIQWSKEKLKKNLNFFKIIFETQKQTCFNKEIQLNLKWKKISSPNFCII